MPALTWARQAVAKVLGRTIYREDTTGRGRSLDGLIIGPLMKQFA